jgi:hypothetical protein
LEQKNKTNATFFDPKFPSVFLTQSSLDGQAMADRAMLPAHRSPLRYGPASLPHAMERIETLFILHFNADRLTAWRSACFAPQPKRSIMARMVFFPGASALLVAALSKHFAKAKLPAEEFSATEGKLTYSGPVSQPSPGNFHWNVNATALAKPQAKQNAPKKAPAKKKARAKKAAKAKPKGPFQAR